MNSDEFGFFTRAFLISLLADDVTMEQRRDAAVKYRKAIEQAKANQLKVSDITWSMIPPSVRLEWLDAQLEEIEIGLGIEG